MLTCPPARCVPDRRERGAYEVPPAAILRCRLRRHPKIPRISATTTTASARNPQRLSPMMCVEVVVCSPTEVDTPYIAAALLHAPLEREWWRAARDCRWSTTARQKLGSWSRSAGRPAIPIMDPTRRPEPPDRCLRSGVGCQCVGCVGIGNVRHGPDCYEEPRPGDAGWLIARRTHSRRYGMAYKQSDTPPVLVPGCEELKCDVVGISKRQCRVVRRVHDATVGDAEFVQTDFPCL